MQFIFMVIGATLGAQANYDWLLGAWIGAALGLALGQSLLLAQLRKAQLAQQNKLQELTRHFNQASADLHRRLSALETQQPQAVDEALTVPGEDKSPPASEPDRSQAQTAAKPAAAAALAKGEEPKLAVEPAALAKPAARAAQIDEARRYRNSDKPAPAVRPAAEIRPEPAPQADWLAGAFNAARNWLLGGNTVLRLGILLLFLGLAFLLRYASAHVLVPVELRYAAVALAAIALLALGWWLRGRRPGYGLMVQGAGIAVLYLTVFAAMRLHPLLPAKIGMLLLLGVTLCSALLAIVQDAKSLAAVAALGGFAAPVLASTGGGSHIALFSYFALLNSGIFLVAWFKAWRILNLIGFVGTFSIGMAWGLRSYTPQLWLSTQAFLLLFFLMFLGIGLLFARRRLLEAQEAPEDDSRQALLKWSVRQTGYVDGSLLFGPPLVGFGLQFAIVQHLSYGAAFSALVLGLIYLGLAQLLLRRGQGRAILLVETYLALGVIFASLAIPLGLDANWTSAAWAVEGAGLYWLGLRQQRLAARLFALLLQVGAALAFIGELRTGYDRLLEGSVLGALLLGCALLFSFLQLRSADKSQLHRWEPRGLPLLCGAGLLFLYLLPPLAFDLMGSVLGWAVAGFVTVLAALYLAERTALLCAFVLQLIAGLMFGVFAKWMNEDWFELSWSTLTDLRFGSPAALALAGVLSAWRLHRFNTQMPSALSPMNAEILSRLALLWGAAWWLFAVLTELHRFTSLELGGQLFLLVMLGTFALSLLVALKQRWPALAQLCMALIPIAMLTLGALCSDFYYSHPFASFGWLLWPALFALHFLLLRRLLGLVSQGLISTVHILGCWLLLVVLSLESCFFFLSLAEHHNAWRWLGWVLLPCAYLALMASSRQWPWPVSAYPAQYRRQAALPVAIVMLAWFWMVNFFSDGSAEPLPYLPLLNPLELGMLLLLFILYRWLSSAALAELVKGQVRQLCLGVLGVSLLALLSMAVCRWALHWQQVPFAQYALWHSMQVQAGLSLVWTLSALALTVGGHLLVQRKLWLAGAGLIGIVVLKLFFVELASSGSLERIISFIGVGVLLLLVGYFAPLPPRREHAEVRP